MPQFSGGEARCRAHHAARGLRRSGSPARGPGAGRPAGAHRRAENSTESLITFKVYTENLNANISLKLTHENKAAVVGKRRVSEPAPQAHVLMWARPPCKENRTSRAAVSSGQAQPAGSPPAAARPPVGRERGGARHPLTYLRAPRPPRRPAPRPRAARPRSWPTGCPWPGAPGSGWARTSPPPPPAASPR